MKSLISVYRWKLQINHTETARITRKKIVLVLSLENSVLKDKHVHKHLSHTNSIYYNVISWNTKKFYQACPCSVRIPLTTYLFIKLKWIFLYDHIFLGLPFQCMRPKLIKSFSTWKRNFYLALSTFLIRPNLFHSAYLGQREAVNI